MIDPNAALTHVKIHSGGTLEVHNALTIRAHFAAMAMQSYMAAGKDYETAAAWAVFAADELIKELNK